MTSAGSVLPASMIESKDCFRLAAIPSLSAPGSSLSVNGASKFGGRFDNRLQKESRFARVFSICDVADVSEFGVDCPEDGGELSRPGCSCEVSRGDSTLMLSWLANLTCVGPSRCFPVPGFVQVSAAASTPVKIRDGRGPDVFRDDSVFMTMFARSSVNGMAVTPLTPYTTRSFAKTTGA